MDASGFDDVPSASLKDDADGCVLLCNLSEPELEEASLADCEEPCLVVDSNNSLSLAVQGETANVRCCTELNSVAASDCVTSPDIAGSSVHVPTVKRKKRFAAGRGLGVEPRKKQKRQNRI